MKNIYLDLIDKKIDEFAVMNNASRTKFEHYKRDGVDYCTVDFGLYKVVFMCGYIGYGYSFYEGYEQPTNDGIVARIKFDFSPICFSPYDIHNALDLREFKTLDFHYVNNEQAMAMACDRLFDFIKANRYSLEEIARSAELQAKLVECYNHDLKVVSKKIYKKGLENNTQKRLRSHEINLKFHNQLAINLSDFAEGKPPKKLQNQFEKLHYKGKLLLFEERYYEYLESHDYAAPEDFTKTLSINANKDRKHITKINFISIFAAIVIVLAIWFVIAKIVNNVCLADYTLINPVGAFDSLTFSTFIAMCSVEIVLEIIVAKIMSKKGCSLSRFRSFSKKGTAVLIAFCIIAFGVCAFAQVNYSFSVVGLGDSDIYYGEGITEQHQVAYGSDDIKFFIIDGYFDTDDSNYVDEADIVFVYGDDYENYCYTGLYDDEIENAINMLESKNITLKHFKSIDEFWDEYNIEYED